MASLKHIMKGLSIATVLGLSLVSPLTTQAASGEPRDCEDFSIIYCGAYSKSEWLKKVSQGDGKHSAANLQKIYFDEGRGITEANFKSSDTVDGRVYKDGRVVVNGKTVATGGHAISRTFKEGSTKSGSVWLRKNSQGFVSDSIPAWVNMKDGEFHYYIIKSCGNAGYAKAVKKPTPSPTPSHTPKPTPSPTHTPKPTPSPTHSTEPTPIPTKTPEVLGTETLPETGAAALLGGVAGLTTIGFAGRSYLRSRKSLMDSLRNKDR